MLFYERRQTNDRFDQEYFMDNIIPSSSAASSTLIGDIVSAASIKQVASCSTDIVATAEAAAIMLNAEKVAAQAAAAKIDDNSSNETEAKSVENSNLAGNKCDIAIKDKDVSDSNTVISVTTTQLPSDNVVVGVTTVAETAKKTTVIVPRTSLLSKELEEWIWQDNRHFLQDRNIFEHTYFK